MSDVKGLASWCWMLMLALSKYSPSQCLMFALSDATISFARVPIEDKHRNRKRMWEKRSRREKGFERKIAREKGVEIEKTQERGVEIERTRKRELFREIIRRKYCERELFREITRKTNARERALEKDHKKERMWERECKNENMKEKWREARNGDGDRTLTTCLALNFIQILDGQYYVWWWIEKIHQHDVDITFLVESILYRKNGRCLIRKTSTSWMIFFLWENIIHIQGEKLEKNNLVNENNMKI